MEERGGWKLVFNGLGGSVWANEKKKMAAVVIARYIPKPEKLILIYSQGREDNISTWVHSNMFGCW